MNKKTTYENKRHQPPAMAY